MNVSQAGSIECTPQTLPKIINNYKPRANKMSDGQGRQKKAEQANCLIPEMEKKKNKNEKTRICYSHIKGFTNIFSAKRLLGFSRYTFQAKSYKMQNYMNCATSLRQLRWYDQMMTMTVTTDGRECFTHATVGEGKNHVYMKTRTIS